MPTSRSVENKICENETCEIKTPGKCGKEFIALDGDYQDAYLLGVEELVESYEGVVYAIVERIDDNEDKLIIVPENKEYTLKEIEEKVNFQEKFFKHKIIK